MNGNTAAMKKFLRLRHFSQALFMVLVFLGLHEYIHPLLIVVFLLAFVAGNYFCGWICPMGAAQELLGKAGSLLVKKKYRLPFAIQRYAQYTKYLFMLALLILVGLQAMRLDELNSLPVDAYQSFTALFENHSLARPAVAFLVFVLILSLFTDRPYCNHLCVNSLEYALPSWTRLFTVKRKASSCIGCRACDRTCPMNIRISEAQEVRNLQCINCLQCTAACPVPRTLSYGKADILLQKIKNKKEAIFKKYGSR